MQGYLGIDVSKGYADFTLLDENKNGLEESFQLDDTRQGHDCLQKLLQENIKQHHLTALYCAVESTGGYENNWYHSLVQWRSLLPLQVVRLNPFTVKSNTQATLQRNVTDALSSRYIAEYVITHNASVNYIVSHGGYAAYRSLHKHINLLKKQHTQLINQAKNVLYSAFPELLRYCKDSMPVWVLEVLKKYPIVQHIARLKPTTLAKINHVDLKKAETLIAKAKNSVGSRDTETDAFLIKQLATEILEKQYAIEKHKKFLSNQCKGPEIDLATSLIGIGSYSAAAIMIEIEDITRFASPKKLVSYFGVHPELKDSGDKKPTYRMSKKGRPAMRSVLYMCAQSAIVHDPHMKNIYHHHRSKGKTHKQASGVIMQKILRILWGVLTSKVPYHAAVDKENQNKKIVTPKESKSKELKQKRRFQPVDTDAPISARQTKTRKVHLESQVENFEQVRDHQNTPDVNL